MLFSWGPIKHRNAKQKHWGFLFVFLKLVCCLLLSCLLLRTMVLVENLDFSPISFDFGRKGVFYSTIVSFGTFLVPIHTTNPSFGGLQRLEVTHIFAFNHLSIFSKNSNLSIDLICPILCIYIYNKYINILYTPYLQLQLHLSTGTTA